MTATRTPSDALGGSRETTATNNEVAQSKLSNRDSRVWLSAIWAGASKVGALLVTVVSVPLAIHALGSERFGIWATITSLFTLLGFLDGGIGNALINIVAECEAKGEKDKLRRCVSTAYITVGFVAASAWLITVISAYFIDWQWLISLPPNFGHEEIFAVVVVAATQFFLLMPLGLSSKIYIGQQKTHLVNGYTLVSSIATVIFTVMAWLLGGGLIAFLIAFAGGQLLGGVVQLFYLIRSEPHIFTPRYRDYSFLITRELLGVGGLFLGLQICSAVSFQADMVIVSHFVGLEAAAELGLVSRMFFVAASLTSLFTAPLWPAFRDAQACGDQVWIRLAFIRYLKLSVGISFATTIIMFVFFNQLMNLLAIVDVRPSRGLVFVFFIWINLLTAGTVIATVLNGLQVVGLQLKLGLVMAILNLILSIILTTQFGVVGVVWGSVISYLLVVLIPYAILVPPLLRQPALKSI